jgi:3-dehydroquinate dehydratase II
MATQPFARTSSKRHRIVIIDGPNMTNLGARNKRVYGSINSIDDLQKYCIELGDSLGVDIEVFVSNYEGAILEHIHATAATADAYILNPAGLTEIGIPTKHALTETGKPVIEVHFANVLAGPSTPRGLPIGPWESVFSPHVTGVMMGLRQYSYAGAIVGLTLALDDPTFLGAEQVA